VFVRTAWSPEGQWGSWPVAVPQFRHCDEPLRRSNPDGLHGGILDCFAAFADDGV